MRYHLTAPAGDIGVVIRAIRPDYFVAMDKRRENHFVVHAEYREPVENEAAKC